MIATVCEYGWGSTCKPYDGGWLPFIICSVIFITTLTVIVVLSERGKW